MWVICADFVWRTLVHLQEKYGSFYADFREDARFASYFYVVAHLFENIACALIEASMQEDTYGMYIATGVLIVVYMTIIGALRPHAEPEDFWFIQSLCLLIIYSLVVAYVSDKLSESELGLSESDTKGLLAASGITLVLMFVFTIYVALPLAEFAIEAIRLVLEKLHLEKRKDSHGHAAPAPRGRRKGASVGKDVFAALASRARSPPSPTKPLESPRPWKPPPSPGGKSPRPAPKSPPRLQPSTACHVARHLISHQPNDSVYDATDAGWEDGARLSEVPLCELAHVGAMGAALEDCEREECGFTSHPQAPAQAAIVPAAQCHAPAERLSKPLLVRQNAMNRRPSLGAPAYFSSHTSRWLHALQVTSQDLDRTIDVFCTDLVPSVYHLSKCLDTLLLEREKCASKLPGLLDGILGPQLSQHMSILPQISILVSNALEGIASSSTAALLVHPASESLQASVESSDTGLLVAEPEQAGHPLEARAAAAEEFPGRRIVPSGYPRFAAVLIEIDAVECRLRNLGGRLDRLLQDRDLMTELTIGIVERLDCGTTYLEEAEQDFHWHDSDSDRDEVAEFRGRIGLHKPARFIFV